MEAHYFDIETYSPGTKPDPKTDKIISIQFQKINLKTGEPMGKLQILKEWEETQYGHHNEVLINGEEEIVKFIYKWFFKRNPWQFVPLGFNLNFEWKFLCAKFKQYHLADMNLGDFVENMPQIDLKVLAVLKKGTFMGASLSSISDKKDDGHVIKEYYEKKQYDKIEQYIIQETQSFIDMYKKIKENIENIL